MRLRELRACGALPTATRSSAGELPRVGNIGPLPRAAEFHVYGVNALRRLRVLPAAAGSAGAAGTAGTAGVAGAATATAGAAAASSEVEAEVSRLSALSDKFAHLEGPVSAFVALRLTLAPAVERLILRDRFELGSIHQRGRQVSSR